MSDDTQLAATREALAKALHGRFGFPSEREWEEQSKDVREGWREDAGALLASGILRDADEVRRDGFENGQATGCECGVQQLKAAIEALCERAERVLDGRVAVESLRALLADGGAAALRDHDEKVWRKGFLRGLRYTGDEPDLEILNPYRDTADGG